MASSGRKVGTTRNYCKTDADMVITGFYDVEDTNWLHFLSTNMLLEEVIEVNLR